MSRSILLVMQRSGPGIVSTKFITDATPALFISHVKSRGKKFDIADQMIESGIEVILGGGRRYFIPKSEDGTLVIVTPDHETGGMAVKDADAEHPKFKPAWVDGGHTANKVPLYAFGPGAERFSGTRQNTDIPRICAEL